ncbi:MAG: hypothetical protein ACK4YF_04335 [Exilispira sp.]
MRKGPNWEKLISLIIATSDSKLQNLFLKINDKELAILYEVGDERLNFKIRTLTGKIKYDKILQELKVLKHQFVPGKTFDFLVLRLIDILEQKDDYKKSSIYLKPKDSKPKK